MKRELMDDGENLAVRWFLAMYGGQHGVTVGQMKAHLEACGFDGCFPDWVNSYHKDSHLTKSGAQDWLRHLFGLEQT